MRPFARTRMTAGLIAIVLCGEIGVAALPKPQSFAIKNLPKLELISKLNGWLSDTTQFEDQEAQDTKVKMDWIYQLRFLVERRYDGTDDSLVRILKFMIELKSKDASDSVPGDNFTAKLIEAIEKQKEKQEPLWLFIQTFVDNIDLAQTQPKTLSPRDYINNFESAKAKVLSPAEIDRLLSKLSAPNQP